MHEHLLMPTLAAVHLSSVYVCEILEEWIARVWISGFSLLQVWELFSEHVQLDEELYRVRSLDCCRSAHGGIVLSSQICHDSYCACGERWAFTQSLRRRF